LKFGAHMSTVGGVWKALRRGVGVGCEIIQIFVKNNLQWFGKPFSPSGVARFAGELAANKLVGVFGHTGYLISLAAPPSTHRDRCIVNDDRFRDSPGCLETPKSADLHEDVENLATLRSLVVWTVRGRHNSR
jgi:endonuclease IV